MRTTTINASWLFSLLSYLSHMIKYHTLNKAQEVIGCIKNKVNEIIFENRYLPFYSVGGRRGLDPCATRNYSLPHLADRSGWPCSLLMACSHCMELGLGEGLVMETGNLAMDSKPIFLGLFPVPVIPVSVPVLVPCSVIEPLRLGLV